MDSGFRRSLAFADLKLGNTYNVSVRYHSTSKRAKILDRDVTAIRQRSKEGRQIFVGIHPIFLSSLNDAEHDSAALVLLGVLANKKFLRSMTKGFMERSARLFEISSLPPRRWRSRYFR